MFVLTPIYDLPIINTFVYGIVRDIWTVNTVVTYVFIVQILNTYWAKVRETTHTLHDILVTTPFTKYFKTTNNLGLFRMVFRTTF